MKQDIFTILPLLKIGQIIRNDTKTFAFIKIESGKAVVEDVASKKKYIISSGNYELTDDFDNTVIQDAKKQLSLECAVRQMRKGQLFIGKDNKEYYFVKFNRTRFVSRDKYGFDYTAKPEFVKEIMDKIVTLDELNSELCQYCNSFIKGKTDVNELCPECKESFGHKFYSDL